MNTSIHLSWLSILCEKGVREQNFMTNGVFVVIYILLAFSYILSQLLMLLILNSILTSRGILDWNPIIIVAACEFEEDKVDSMEVQQALPPVPEVSEPLPLAQDSKPLFEIQASEVNQEDIWS